MNKCYSINDEEYNFIDAGDAIEALDHDGRLVVGAVYYEMDCEPVELADFLSAANVLERAGDYAHDELGECAEDAFSVTKEAESELDALLEAWAEKHLSNGSYWRCIGKARELRVTAEDVAEYGGGAE